VNNGLIILIKILHLKVY